MIKIILQNERGSYVFQNGSWTNESTGQEVSDTEVVSTLNSEVADALPQEIKPAPKVYIKPVVDKGDNL